MAQNLTLFNVEKFTDKKEKKSKTSPKKSMSLKEESAVQFYDKIFDVNTFSDAHDDTKEKRIKPLYELLRPSTWEHFYVNEKFDKNLFQQLRTGKGVPPSLILWGQPGTGKTTLAKLIGKSFDCNFIQFSAVLGGVKEVRDIVTFAKKSSKKTVLFVDEIHRFNKAQQDAFLPHIEDGTIILIGATTENPSFSLNNALLSRTRVVVLEPLSDDTLSTLLEYALKNKGMTLEKDAAKSIVGYALGDGRKLLNLAEGLIASLSDEERLSEISKVKVEAYIQSSVSYYYDRSGEDHYNLASAFIKSMRGSDPDAALYWAFRMIKGGEDPRFVFRRLLIFASEDIGNADPLAVIVANAAFQSYETVGMPEGRIPLAQAITYLSTAPKSNRSYEAMHKAIAAVDAHPDLPVPLHLRNAPTKLMKTLGYGEGYKYVHNYENSYVEGEVYLPEELKGVRFYEEIKK
jgi:putative ATPase